MRFFLCNLMNEEDDSLTINSLSAFSPGDSAACHYKPLTDQDPTKLDAEALAALRPHAHRSMAQAADGNLYVKTHSYLGSSFGVPTITPDVTRNAIYIVRNPLDVCVSLASYIGQSEDVAIQWMGRETAGEPSTQSILEFWHSWSVNVGSWTTGAQREIKVVRYEDMLWNTRQTFIDVVSFLGLAVSDQRIDRAIRLSSFSNMREQEMRDGFDASPHASTFFRAGYAGSWRDRLEDGYVARLVHDHGEQMKRFDYLPIKS